MALIRSFFEMSQNSGREHSRVDCGYKVITADNGDRLLQLDTFGSDVRKLEGKSSQSIQLDQERATELVAVLRVAFPGLP